MAQLLDRALCPVLVGRTAQLEVLEDALLAANRGEGQVVVLAGEAGMGKTRLAEELRAAAQRAGTVVMEGSCPEAELALPYLPFLEAIGNYVAVADLDDLRERLGPFRRELAQLFPQVDPEAGHGDGGDPTQGRLRLFEALIALLSIPADQQGVLLIVEDIHWADASTRELLDYMTRRLRSIRIMVLATYRSDELHRRHPLLPMVQGWRRAGTARTVELEPLTPDGIADMVRAIFDTEEVSDEFRDFLHERTEGNPFVLEELLKAALDRGDIYRTQAGWERRELRELKLPATVTDTVLLRLERLGEEDADILRAAAVLGRSFDYRTLAAVAGPGEERVQEGLRLFVQQQLMEEEADTRRYRFRHALTREAIYGDLISPKRMDLHARAAVALRDVPGTPPVDLAYHLLAAERHEEAIPMAMAAARDALRRRGFREAMELYERILPFVAAGGARGEVLCELAEATYFSGEPGRAQGLFEQGVAILESEGRTQDGAHYRLYLGRCYWERSRPNLARAEYERVRDILEPFGPSEDLANAYIRLAGLPLFEFQPQEALRIALQARDAAEAARATASRIWAEVFVGSALLAIGGKRFEEGLEVMERARREAMEARVEWIAGNALFNELETRIEAFQPREALERLGLFQGVWSWYPMGPPVAYIEGSAYLHMGEPERALPLLERAKDESLTGSFTTFAAWASRGLAVVYSMLGRHDDARASLPGAEGRQARQDAVPVAETAMRVYLDAGDQEAALAEATTALELLDKPTTAWVVPERRAADKLHEVLVALGRSVDAAKVTGRLAASNVDPDDPYIARIEGRAALAAGDLERAAARLQHAIAFFRGAGYRDDEWRTRRLHAGVLSHRGEAAGAERELRSVLVAAQEHGHVLEAQRALDQLTRLGPSLSGEAAALPEPSGAPRGVAAKAPRGSSRTSGVGAAGRPSRTSEVVATVMFMDVRGYTAMTAKRAPKETVDRLASLHRWAKQEVERHHGVVDKFAGDAVMAVFNASGARLDHAVHALQAALAIRDKAAYGGMPVGIGLATGPAVVGQLTEGANVSAVGETTNLAARLQSAAGAGEIVLSEETHRRTREWLAGRAIDAEERYLRIKGLEKEVRTYRLASRGT